MKIPFVTFKSMEAELDKELIEAFNRVYQDYDNLVRNYLK